MDPNAKDALSSDWTPGAVGILKASWMSSGV